MESKFIATLYRRIELIDNVYIFKREGVIQEASINLLDELNPLTYYENNEKKELYSIDSIYVAASEEEYYYGYPLDYVTLEQIYKDTDDLIFKYIDDISEAINIGYYDEENDEWKIIITNEEQLKEADDLEIFNQYELSYDSKDEEERIAMPANYITKMIKCIKLEKYSYLKEKLIELNNGIYNANKQLQENLHVDLKEDIKYEEKEEKKAIENPLDELNNLIGIKNIKEEVNKLFMYLKFREKTEKYLNLEKPNLHMFFTGNPGTGKTTVARIISKLLYDMGYIKSAKVAEITPKDLIAEYVGQTAIKTANFINKNRGGVIFIDEAYVLASSSNEFADEALVEILKELEKLETVFIFAGYKDEMKNFLSMNPGLESRIGYYLNYEDYSVDELLKIFELKITKMGFMVEEELKEEIKKLLEKQKNVKNFGNGRYIDKLINKIILEHAVNKEKYKSRKKLVMLTKEDLSSDIEDSLSFKVKKKKIGFGG